MGSPALSSLLAVGVGIAALLGVGIAVVVSVLLAVLLVFVLILVLFHGFSRSFPS